MASALALPALTGIVVGIERSVERWFSPSLAWSICGAFWALGAVAMFSFLGAFEEHPRRGSAGVREELR